MLANGTRLSGETRISRSTERIERVELRPRKVKPLKETLASTLIYAAGWSGRAEDDGLRIARLCRHP